MTSGVGSRPSQAPPPVPEWSRERAVEPEALSHVWGGRTSLEPWIGPPLGTLCLPSGLSGLRACLHGRRGRTGPDTVPAFVLAPRPIGDQPSYPSIMITTNTHETHPLCQAHGCGAGAHSHLEVIAVTTMFPWRLRYLKASGTRLSSHNC